jgi:hypothetical protein
MTTTIRGSDNFDTAGKGTLVSGTAVTASSTNHDFTGIPSWVKRITVMGQSITTSGSTSIIVQIGTGGTADSSGYVSAGLHVNDVGVTSASSSTSAFLVWLNTTSARSFTVTITKVTGNSWNAAVSGGSNVAGTYYALGGGGTNDLSGTLDMVRVTTVSGTSFTGGTLNILYE